MSVIQNLQAFILGLRGRTRQPQLRCTSPISLASAGGGVLTFDLTFNQNNNAQFIEAGLTAYIDNGGNANGLAFQFSSGQQLFVSPNTAGYYPILQPNPMQFSCTVGAGSTAYMQLINELIPASNWTATAL